MLKCKKEGLIPTFVRPKISIEGSARLRKRSADLTIKTELKTKHKAKNELKEVQRLSISIHETTSFLLYNTMRYKVRLVVSTRRRRWTTTHNKKLEALCNKRLCTREGCWKTDPSRILKIPQKTNLKPNFWTFLTNFREPKYQKNKGK